MLLDMQNRGQLAAGMTSFHLGRTALLKTHKEVGTMAEAFRLNHKAKFEAIMRGQDGLAAIGHVRYATCGGADESYAQPFEREHGRTAKWFAFAFNGQLANYQELKQELLDQGDYHLKRDTDTEILMHLLSHELQVKDSRPIGRVFTRLADRLDGAYNIVLLSAKGDLIVARDPLGFRPLCIAEHGPLFAAASESSPLANLGFQNIRSLEPRTMVIANREGVRTERFAASPRPRPLLLRVDLLRQRREHARRSLGLSAVGRLWARNSLGSKTSPLDPETIVVPVPDTAKAAADAMAFALGVRSVEGLMRNRYVGRTFIEGTADRAAKARLKYTPLPEVLAGKRVLLVEDSIVRSTTMRALVHEIRDRGGAWRFTCGWHVRRSSLLVSMGSICQGGTSSSPPSSSTLPTAGSRKKIRHGWPRNWGRTVCVTSPLRPSHARSPCRPTSSVGPVSRVNTPVMPARSCSRSTSPAARNIEAPVGNELTR